MVIKNLIVSSSIHKGMDPLKHMHALFKVYTGETEWKATGD
jgi:hypothetical protein